MYNVKIDEKKCIGCGSCEAICPDVFSLDEKKMKAKVKKSKTESECVEEAKEACPVGAITMKKVQ